MAATRRAVTKWLEYENQSAKPQQGDSLSLLYIHESEEPPPEQPQALALLRQSRRFNVPVFPGSLQDWPQLARLELNAALNAEDEYAQMVALNLKLKAFTANDQTQ